MHYFSGIYSQGNKKVLEKNLDYLLINGKKTENSLRYIKDNFGFVSESPRSAPVFLSTPIADIDNKNNILVLLEGKIYNLEQLINDANINKTEKKIKMSDAQRISALYESLDIEFFKLLEGDFILVIFDKQKNKIILHKSRFGLKSFFYFFKNASLVFSSNLNSLIRWTNFKKEVDFSYLYSYLFLDNLNLNGQTEYKNIISLEAGKILIINKKEVYLKKITYPDLFDFENASEESIINTFYNTLKESVQRQISRVDSANIAFSGGIDSRIIGALAKEMQAPINAFTAKFETKIENKLTDYKLANRHAKILGAKHHVMNLGVKKFIKDLPDLLLSSERLINFNDFNKLIIFNWISSLNASVMSGDGIEEQLSLYSYHLPALYSELLINSITEPWRKKATKLASKAYFDLFFARSWGWPSDEKNIPIFSKNFLLNKGAQEKIRREAENIFKTYLSSAPKIKNQNSQFFNQALWLDFNYNLTPKTSTICNYLSQKNNAEIILPYFDQKFVSATSKIPTYLKFKPGTNGKYILRVCAKRLFKDNNIFSAFKSGSDIPFEEWLIHPLFERFVNETLTCKKTKISSIINPRYIERIIDEHYENKSLIAIKDPKKRTFALIKGGKNHTHKILKLLGLETWLKNNF